MTDETTVAVLGNVFMAQDVSRYRYEPFRRVVEFLRAADVTLANLECTIPDPEDPAAFVAGTGWAGTYMAGTPAMLENVKFAGIDGLCAANNHVADFGEAGILSTIRHLRATQLPHAGIGASLTEASEPAYVDAKSGLRVAFLAACDWGPRGDLGLNFPWPVGYFPSDDAPPFRPRPGINLLRYEAVSHVRPEQLEQLRRMSCELGWERDKIYRRHGFYRDHQLVGMTTNVDVEVDTDKEFHFLGRKFVASDQPGHETVPCMADVDRMCKHVREASRQADIVMVALHDQSHGLHPHTYARDLAHAVIDAGADVCFNNGGGHRGVEIYRERAILHGVPTFFLQTEAVTHVPSSAMARYGLPADSSAADFVESRAKHANQAARAAGGDLPDGYRLLATGSAAHVCVFDKEGGLREVRIHPFEPLGGMHLMVGSDASQSAARLPRFRMGLPVWPEPGSPMSERILGHTAEASNALGTHVEVEDGVATVRI